MWLLAVHSLHRWSIQVDLRVNDEKWVIGVDDIVVDTYTIEILLQQRLEEHVLFLEGGLLLLDSKLVEKDFVVSLVEVVQELELVVGVLFHSIDLLDWDIWSLFKGDFVTLVEWKYLLLFGFKFSAKLGCLEDLDSQFFIALKGIHTSLRVGGEISKSLFLLISCFGHSNLEVTIMVDDLVFLSHEGFVSIVTLFLVLFSFEFQELDLLLQTVNLLLVFVDLL